MTWVNCCFISIFIFHRYFLLYSFNTYPLTWFRVEFHCCCCSFCYSFPMITMQNPLAYCMFKTRLASVRCSTTCVLTSFYVALQFKLHLTAVMKLQSKFSYFIYFSLALGVFCIIYLSFYRKRILRVASVVCFIERNMEKMFKLIVNSAIVDAIKHEQVAIIY